MAQTELHRAIGAVVWTAWWLMLIGIVSIFIAMQERRVAIPRPA